jgi:hypothetical protein
LVKFDVSQFAPSTQIDKATMEMYVEGQPRTGSATANVYLVSKDWIELEATWFKASSSDWWDEEGGDFEPKIEASCEIPSNATGKWEEWDVTSCIQNFIDNPETNFGFHFFMNVTMVTVEYTSSESNNQQNRPKLTIETATAIENSPKKSNELIRLIKTADSYLVYLPFTSNSSVKVYDVKGKQIASFNTLRYGEWHRLPNSIKPGVHIIKINNKEKSIVKKLWFVK